MAIDLTQLSRTMAYALRHQPARFGLHLDDEGWVLVEDLLTSLRQQKQEWRRLQSSDFAQVIEQSEKKRYEMRDGKIRAYYGHSVAQKVVREQAEPPEILYHGTTPQAAQRIKREGLKPMGRQYVHLSEDEETARIVALRRTSQPVIIQVQARQASQQGIAFYLGNDRVWLADPVPSTFLQ